MSVPYPFLIRSASPRWSPYGDRDPVIEGERDLAHDVPDATAGSLRAYRSVGSTMTRGPRHR